VLKRVKNIRYKTKRMFRETLAQIKHISNLLPDPTRAERVMHARLMSNNKLCKKVLARDLLSVLYKQKIGTKVVDDCVKNLCRGSTHRKRKEKLTRFIMKDKLEDSEREVKEAKREYHMKTKEYRKQIEEGGSADKLFKNIMKRDTEKTWTEGKRKKQKKIKTLIERKDEENGEKQNETNEMKTIKYKDTELEKIEKQQGNDHSYTNQPRLYGGAQIDCKVAKVLSKDPGFMILNNINDIEIEVEIEKGLTKARYELMSRGQDEDEIEKENGEKTQEQSHKEEINKVLQYSKPPSG